MYTYDLIVINCLTCKDVLRCPVKYWQMSMFKQTQSHMDLEYTCISDVSG